MIHTWDHMYGPWDIRIFTLLPQQMQIVQTCRDLHPVLHHWNCRTRIKTEEPIREEVTETWPTLGGMSRLLGFLKGPEWTTGEQELTKNSEEWWGSISFNLFSVMQACTITQDRCCRTGPCSWDPTIQQFWSEGVERKPWFFFFFFWRKEYPCKGLG